MPDDEFLLRLDDRLCDALMATRWGKYDGLTVEQHLESLIQWVREGGK